MHAFWFSIIVYYVEGSVEDAERYSDAVARVLARWDGRSPHPLIDRHRGQLRRMWQWISITWKLRALRANFRAASRASPIVSGCTTSQIAPSHFSETASLSLRLISHGCGAEVSKV
jgi:hypothetical protein